MKFCVMNYHAFNMLRFSIVNKPINEKTRNALPVYVC